MTSRARVCFMTDSLSFSWSHARDGFEVAHRSPDYHGFGRPGKCPTAKESEAARDSSGPEKDRCCLGRKNWA